MSGASLRAGSRVPTSLNAWRNFRRVLLAAVAMLVLWSAPAAQAQIAPAAGYWWNPVQGGRGFVIEIQGTTMFMAGFLYATSGEATWVASSGPMTSPTQYSGSLITYTGGQTLTGAYQMPSPTPPLGTLAITFTASNQGTLTWPGGTIPIQRFDFGPGGSSGTQPATNPQTGWWLDPTEGGRGFAIEVQGGAMYFAGYMYDSSGNPTWYLANGFMTGSSLFSNEWQQFGYGQTLTGPYQAPSVVNAEAGAVTMQFSNTSTATLTLPNGAQIPLIRYNFGGSTTPPTAQNVQPITVDAGPQGGDSNIGFISVTICVPGTSTCQTIDHIDVDTGSSGLRIISSVLSPSMVLKQQTSEYGGTVAECTQFEDGYTWGSVRLGDLTIAGETVKSLPIQLIGDPLIPNVPPDCSSTGPGEDTVATFGANGIIGVGFFQADCGTYCAQNAVSGGYYSCEAGECVAAPVAVSMQVQNPVGLFATDNNGVLIQLPSVPAYGAATVSGSLIFGIGTQSNNALGNVTVYSVDPGTGYLTAYINNKRYPDSFVDSGSSAYFLPRGLATVCTSQMSQGYFCPNGTINFNVTVQGNNGASGQTSISIANADNLFNGEPAYTAFGNLGAVNSDDTSIDLGLPFFFGRNIFTAIENKSTPGGTGPYVAF